eukprot:gene15685-21792_t
MSYLDNFAVLSYKPAHSVLLPTGNMAAVADKKLTLNVMIMNLNLADSPHSRALGYSLRATCAPSMDEVPAKDAYFLTELVKPALSFSHYQPMLVLRPMTNHEKTLRYALPAFLNIPDIMFEVNAPGPRPPVPISRPPVPIIAPRPPVPIYMIVL